MKDWINQKTFHLPEDTVVAVGKFDGEHRGHQKIIATMLTVAREQGLKTAIFTFGTPPAAVVSGQRRPQILTNEERRERLHQAGIDYIVEYPFDAEIAAMDGEDFVREILLGAMRMRAIVGGEDLRFGKAGAVNAAKLKSLGERLHFSVYIIQKETEAGEEISSSLIREALAAGDMAKANTLLGMPYTAEGVVQHGNGIGNRILGFPTINLLLPAGKLLPRRGVYQTETVLPDGRTFRSITNVGTNPSVEQDHLSHRLRLESFLLDFSGNLYDTRVRLRFLRFIRPEKKFVSLTALKQQIMADLSSID
ncbi:bifunctional riboflavin kinase/FAD synthetase [Stomatobaculum longum]|uniref:bifunctional riboflavin kinase/FAD synthetase n=1 Tax=Stomatobaculum longum TaxID=796942 RepID=UPI0028E1CCF1|nr:bifunctional riboflavin kinase/FAD synthetase [Stomatobaculum longum]